MVYYALAGPISVSAAEPSQRYQSRLDFAGIGALKRQFDWYSACVPGTSEKSKKLSILIEFVHEMKFIFSIDKQLESSDGHAILMYLTKLVIYLRFKAWLLNATMSLVPIRFMIMLIAKNVIIDFYSRVLHLFCQ